MREPPSVPFLGKKYRETAGMCVHRVGLLTQDRLGLEEVIPQRPPPTLGPPLAPLHLLPCSLSPVSKAIMKLGFHLQTN